MFNYRTRVNVEKTRSRILTKFEQRKKLTLQSEAEECERILNLMIQQKLKNRIVHECKKSKKKKKCK